MHLSWQKGSWASCSEKVMSRSQEQTQMQLKEAENNWLKASSPVSNKFQWIILWRK